MKVFGEHNVEKAQIVQQMAKVIYLFAERLFITSKVGLPRYFSSFTFAIEAFFLSTFCPIIKKFFNKKSKSNHERRETYLMLLPKGECLHFSNQEEDAETQLWAPQRIQKSVPLQLL